MKWNFVLFIYCLKSISAQDIRSKGEPPKILQHKIQQKLLTSDPNIIEYFEQKPFRASPYDPQNDEEYTPLVLDEEVIIEEQKPEDSGISVTVDERTFDTLGSNMGRFVKTAAKDLRGMVDGVGNFVHNSIKATLAPKKRPTKGFDLFGLLPPKNNGNPSSAYGVPQAAPLSPNIVDSYGLPIPQNLPPLNVQNPSSSYGVPTAPPLSNPQTPSSSYGIPSAPPITNSQNPSYGIPSVSSISNDYAAPPSVPSTTSAPANTNYGTNFQDIRDVGPSIESLQIPTTSTANPFLPQQTSTTAKPFIDPIYRPKRNKIRPGTPPPHLFSTTHRPKPTPTLAIHQRDKDLNDVKLAWYNYYHKAKNYVRTYKERIDVRDFQPFPGERKRPIRRQFKRPKNNEKSLHPVPFSGKVHMQLPFKPKPLFKMNRPRPPSPRPTRMRPPSLNFMESERREQPSMEEMDALHDTLEVGILTPPRLVDEDYFYYIYDDDYQDYDISTVSIDP